MNLTKNQTIVVLVAIGVVLLTLLVFLGIVPGLKSAKEQATKLKGELSFWGISDPGSAYQGALDAFKRKYPNITIHYRQFNDPEEYRKTLLDALAAGTGPDIFMIHNNDLYRDSNKIVPAPFAQLSLLDLKNKFPQVVEQDFAPQGVVYALPLSIDTLALIYNHDLLDAAATPVPDSWDKFLDSIPRLVKLSSGKNIDVAASAIGGSTKTIDTATDILGLLMLQSGTAMTSANFERATLASKEGVSAFSFYTQFADPKKTSYTWSDAMPNYLDAFAREKVVMIIDYASTIAQIKFRNNFLNVAVAPAPQLIGTTKPVAYPSYYGYAVSRQTKRPDIVWDFIIGMTTSRDVASGYIALTHRPPALRELIDAYLGDAELGVFARQALIARSWAQVDRGTITKILSDAISAVIQGNSTPEKALNEAQNSISELMAKRVF